MDKKNGGATLGLSDLVDYLEYRLEYEDDEDTSFVDLYLAYKQRGIGVFKERGFADAVNKLKKEVRQWEV